MRRISTLKTAIDFEACLDALDLRDRLPFDAVLEAGASPLAAELRVMGASLRNRFAILPMEGWDATAQGTPSDLTLRRWRRFGESGASLIFGGEAVAVVPEGRANPNQLVIGHDAEKWLALLRKSLGASVDLVGLQLTHSGRFSRPNGEPAPLVAYAHPILDVRFASPPCVLDDDALQRLVDRFAHAARLAEAAGFDFVDIKHCHGYLLHELLSGWERPGPFGGSFENRTRFLRDVVSAVRAETSTLRIAVRLSAFDFCPFVEGPGAIGRPVADSYSFAFGGDRSGAGIDLSEPLRFLSLLEQLGIELCCITAGSPYYNPHIQRPALFPPSDGYLPPEDPLVSVARQIDVVRLLKSAHPKLVFVGSGYSYLQEWLPHVAQAVVRSGWVDLVGLGRMALSYHDFPADVLAGRTPDRKRLCRTFSDCTTGPRLGFVSGCYPLDPDYKGRPEHEEIKKVKVAIRARRREADT